MQTEAPALDDASAAHAAHAVAPAAALNVLAAHSVQLAAPGSALDAPGAHARHALAAGPAANATNTRFQEENYILKTRQIFIGGIRIQTRVQMMNPSVECIPGVVAKVPAAHEEHAVDADAAHCPLAHSVHAVAPDAAPVEYRAAHVAHALASAAPTAALYRPAPHAVQEVAPVAADAY